MNSNELTQLFSEYNAEYFNENIKGYKVVAYKHLESRLGQCDGVKKEIQVDETLNDVASRETLLHEMVHAYVGNENGHNNVFNAECERIEKLTGLNLRRYRMTEKEKEYLMSLRQCEYDSILHDLRMWRERGDEERVNKILARLDCYAITKSQQKKLLKEFKTV